MGRLELKEPGLEKDRGLEKILVDMQGNRFNADNYSEGFEMIADYPHEAGKPDKIAHYEVHIDDFNRKYWKMTKEEQWVKDEKRPYSFCGKWEEVRE